MKLYYEQLEQENLSRESINKDNTNVSVMKKNNVKAHLIAPDYDELKTYINSSLPVDTLNQSEQKRPEYVFSKYLKNKVSGTTINERRLLQSFLIDKKFLKPKDISKLQLDCDGNFGPRTKEGLKLYSEQLLMNKLIDLWYSSVVASGILGNAFIESYNYKIGLYYDTTAWSHGKGLFQRTWTRKQKLINKKNRTSYDVQLDLMHDELMQMKNKKSVYTRQGKKYSYSKLESSQNTNDATEIFCGLFERPKNNSSLEQRKEAAQRIFTSYSQQQTTKAII